MALKTALKRAKPIMTQIAKVLAPLPRTARRSVTFDRGSAFLDGPHLQADVGAGTQFGGARSPL